MQPKMTATPSMTHTTPLQLISCGLNRLMQPSFLTTERCVTINHPAASRGFPTHSTQASGQYSDFLIDKLPKASLHVNTDNS